MYTITNLNFRDWWLIEEENYNKFTYENMYTTAAEQFFDQLEGSQCDAFVEALALKAASFLNDRDIECGGGTTKLKDLLGKINELKR